MRTMRTIYLSLSILLLAGFPGCDNQKPSQPLELVKGEEEKGYEKVSVTFDHPCAYVNAEDIERVRAHVAAADASDPVYAAWQAFCSSEWAQETLAGEQEGPVVAVIQSARSQVGNPEKVVITGAASIVDSIDINFLNSGKAVDIDYLVHPIINGIESDTAEFFSDYEVNKRIFASKRKGKKFLNEQKRKAQK